MAGFLAKIWISLHSIFLFGRDNENHYIWIQWGSAFHRRHKKGISVYFYIIIVTSFSGSTFSHLLCTVNKSSWFFFLEKRCIESILKDKTFFSFVLTLLLCKFCNRHSIYWACKYKWTLRCAQKNKQYNFLLFVSTKYLFCH